MTSPAPQPREPAAPSGVGGHGILIFGFGAAAGVLLAYSGIGYLQDSAALIATVFLSALMVILLLGGIIFALRRVLWRRLFGFAEVQIEHLATPLASVAERAIAGDPAGATQAARDLVALALARYSWVATRRWIVAALTALIAAMAALAGTALLFKQNQLIEAQSGLLTEQNARIAEQTLLLSQDVQLAEAARNAALAVEITQIAADLGVELDRIFAGTSETTGQPSDNPFNVLLADELSRELVLRITSVSQATRPYRFLQLTQAARTQDEALQLALQRRRADLPNTYARLADRFEWAEPSGETPLIDRPASPERGQLLTVLMSAGVLNLETFNRVGMDLGFAHLQGATIALLTTQGGRLDYADFSRSHLAGVDLGGASLIGMRCQRCTIRQSSLAQVEAGAVRPPFDPAGAPMATRAAGIDLQRSVIRDTRFGGAQMLAANLDDTLLVSVDFSGAALALSTFRRAVLLAPVWAGADLKNADFDGAVLFGADVLADLGRAAAFDRTDYRADAISRDKVMGLQIVLENLTLADIDRLTGAGQAYRLTRIQPFDDGLAP